MIGPSQPGFTFSEVSIDANAPAQSGVYALYTTSEWVYIGETGNIRNRLKEHLRDQRIMRYRPTGFCFELHPEMARMVRERQLIGQLDPSANRL